MSGYMASKKSLEINANHPIIRNLKERAQESADKTTTDLITMLYEVSLLVRRFPDFYLLCGKTSANSIVSA